MTKEFREASEGTQWSWRYSAALVIPRRISYELTVTPHALAHTSVSVGLHANPGAVPLVFQEGAVIAGAAGPFECTKSRSLTV